MEGKTNGDAGLWERQKVPVTVGLVSGWTDAPRAPWRRWRERAGEKEEAKDEDDAGNRASVHGEQLEEFWQILGCEIVRRKAQARKALLSLGC